MTAATPANDKGYFRRKFPRRSFVRLVGVLGAGHYEVFQSGEIGEGGMSIVCPEALPEGLQIVVSFQIPGGDFVSLRSVVRSIRQEKGHVAHGLSFENIQFTHKRQIRSFVSARTEQDEVV